MKRSLLFYIVLNALISTIHTLKAQIIPGIQWERSFGGNDYEYLTCIRQTPDGGYIAGGTSESIVSGNKTQPSKGYADYWLVKLDILGNKQWDRSFGGSNDEYLLHICLTSDGGYI